MKYIRFLFWALLTIFACDFFNNPFKAGDTPVPALGKLLNPFSGFWQNAESSDYSNQTLTLQGNDGDIEILFDKRMVPHIYAQSLEDALFAQGYVEAYHRLFQMDISTRFPSGRLSEVLGESLLETDRSQRRLGLGYAADNAVKGWKKFPAELKGVEKYVDGINALISSLDAKNLPFEYKLLNFKPEPWTMTKSALMLKAMSYDLCSYEEDVAFTNALKYFGPENFEAIYPERNPKDDPIIPTQENWKTFRDYEDISHINLLEGDNYFKDILRKRSPDGIGSNNWAVAGSKTASGKPLLASDPHLGLSLPSIWYEIHITTPEFSSYGVTILGMPGIMIGFNQNIAWGETNVGHDVMDWYKIKWLNAEKTKYELDGKVKDITYRIETMNVKGKSDPVIDSVKYTVWGPVAATDDKNHQDMALHWLPHDIPDMPEFRVFVDAMRSKDYDEFLQNTGHFIAPAQNFVFASATGDIALRVNGRLPKKTDIGDGRFVEDGSLSSSGWPGFIDRDQNPQMLNPERGFVGSANQFSASPDYPYYYHGSFEGYRGRMVNRLLGNGEEFTVDDMKSMQANTFNIRAEESLPNMLATLDAKHKSNDYISQLEKWDYHFDREMIEPTVFSIWFSEFKKLLWDEVYSINDSIQVPYPDNWHTSYIIMEDSLNAFFDKISTEKIETIEDISLESFELALERLEKVESKYGTLAWGQVRKTSIDHPTQIPALSATDVIVDGSGDALNANNPGFGPSWRMVVDFANDYPEVQAIYPGGQSGNPGSPFYKNMIEKWSNNQYDTIIFPRTKADLEGQTLFTIKMNTNE